MTRFILSATATLVLSGCVSYSTLTPAEGSRVEYSGGLPILTSEGHSSIVQVMPGRSDYETGKRVRLVVNVVNPAPAAFEFDIAHISASNGVQPVRVYTYEQLVKEIRQQAMWASIGQALETAGKSMQASNAGYNNSYTTGTVYGSGGSASYSANTTTYDYGAAQAARARVDAESRARMAEIASTRDDALAFAENLVRRTTLSPGESYTGLVVLDAPRGELKTVSLTVNVAGDVHDFQFNYVPVH